MGERSRFGLRLPVIDQRMDRGLNAPGRVFRFRNPYREPEPFETSQICDLLDLHAYANDRLTRQYGSQDRSDASMNDGEIGHFIDLKRRDPVGDEDVRRNMDTRDPFKVELYGSYDAVWRAFEALDDPGNDLRRTGASHREVDKRLVIRNGSEFPGDREFVSAG